MPNPVAVNDLTPISGSLQTSRISYGVETAGKNYGQNYNGTTWYSDIPNGGEFYTIISDNYTANYYISRSNAEGAYVEGGLPAVDEYSAPVFWTTVGTSSLDVITIVNGLPDRRGQIPFNLGSQALNWIASSSNYFAVGPDYYAQIDADNLRLYLDASQIISYPTTASTWYDLSGNSKNGTLINAPTFNSNGWIDFDGSDDYIQYNDTLAAGLSQFTWNANVLFDAIQPNFAAPYYQLWIDENALWIAQYGNAVGIDIQQGTSPTWFDGNGGGVTGAQIGLGQLTTGRWYNFTWTFNSTGNEGSSGQVRGYLNSTINVTVNTNQTGVVKTGTSNTQIATRGGSQYFNGQIKDVKFYSKTLTAAEVAQNYYGGPIVTNGLIYAIDAGNLVSYPKSGTTVYPLTGSNTDILTNGVGFSPIDGGVWTFDGVDDYIYLDANPWPANGFTNDSVSIWFKFSNYGVILGQSSTTPFAQSGWVPAIYIDTSFYLRTSMFWGGSVGNQSISPSPLSINTWYNVTVTNGNNTQKTYLNGELMATLSKTQTSYADVYYYTLGAGVWNSWNGATGAVGYLQGQIANLYYYDKELTADEVLQNYNATK